MKIGSIVIHCYEFELMVAFWQAALDYIPREAASQDWVVLCDPKGLGPNLSFQAREKRPPQRSWIHLDLYAENRELEVKRLIKLGAKPYPWRYPDGAM